MNAGFKERMLAALLMGLTISAYAEGTTPVAQKPESIMPAVQNAKWAAEWWMPRHEEKLNQIKRGNIDLLMIGDSITHSWETRGRQVWDKYYKNRNAANLGFSGDRTEHVLWRLQNGEVKGISPRLTVIMIGTNNTGHRQESAKDTALGVKMIIKELRTRLPETKVLVLAIFPRSATKEDVLRKRNDEINTILSGYADNKHVFYLDINNVFLDDEGNLPKSVMNDLLHPNEHGYELWAKAMEPTIVKLMAEPAPEASPKEEAGN